VNVGTKVALRKRIVLHGGRHWERVHPITPLFDPIKGRFVTWQLGQPNKNSKILGHRFLTQSLLVLGTLLGSRPKITIQNWFDSFDSNLLGKNPISPFEFFSSSLDEGMVVCQI
jgi:hypothetical protein